MNRNGFWASLLYRLFDQWLLPFAERHRISPDQCSWAGLFLSLLAGLSFAFSPFTGALLLTIAGGCDVFDGHLARSLGIESKAGAFLDSVFDRYGEFFILAGIWGWLFGLPFNQLLVALSILSALSGSFLVSYVRARGEGLGVHCSEGRFQRGERILILMAAGFFDFLEPGALCLFAVMVIAIGSHFTALHRLRLIAVQLEKNESSGASSHLE